MTTLAIDEAHRTANPWVMFAIRRLGRFLLSLLILITAAFAMIRLIPGDPVRAALGAQAPQSLVDAQRAALGLDRPIPEQFMLFVGDVLTGDLGDSLITRQPVTQVIADRLPATVQLAVIAFVFTLLVAIPLGLLFAVLTRDGRRRSADLAFSGVTGVFGAVPEFLLAVGLVFVFAVQWQVFDVAGRTDAASFVLPVLALSAGAIAILARLVRVEANRVLQEEYIRTARSKRLPDRIIYLRHALPNVLTASLTLAGLLLSGMLAGTVLIENVFSWPGLGTTIVQSITTKDYAVVQAIVLIYGAGALIINLVVDVILAVIDPRSTIRES
ncbi:ABC transporter permease [Microbacterium aerolatum]|uniref:ABC transporter permease n=1 Tax=Microbacterium aerolatum TaxID=153731 RepID=UPI00384A8F20